MKISNFSLVVISLLFTIAVSEIGARIYIGAFWEESRKKYYTEQTTVRGRISSHHYLPYKMTNKYLLKNNGKLENIHNSLGFRGKEIKFRKGMDTVRVVAVGASTTYGIYVKPDQTYSAVLEDMLSEKFGNVEVINAGVPGYLSTDNLIYIQMKVLPINPDIVIIYQGRNELFPESFNKFSVDYSHFRKSDYSFYYSNYFQKKLFSISHLALLLGTFRGHRFGWSQLEENPGYASIRYENQPTDAEIIKNLNRPDRSKVYREAVRSMLSILQSRNIKVILATMAFRETEFATGVLKVRPKNAPKNDNDPAVYDALRQQVEKNNEIATELAAQYGAIVADTASLRKFPELFLDDCHVTEEGHKRRAKILYDVILDNKLIESVRMARTIGGPSRF